MIKFTIVTCTYNAEAVLQRTLDSVMKQTYCNIEHLIIDGVSKDKTLTMVKAYQHKNDVGESAHEILVFSEPDKGLYDAMNKGIDRATGDYLIFLNAGDVFPSEDTLEFVEGCVGEGEELPGVLYGDTDIVNMDGHFLRHRRLTPPKRLSWRSFMWGMLFVISRSMLVPTLPRASTTISTIVSRRMSIGASASCERQLVAICLCAMSMPSSTTTWMVACRCRIIRLLSRSASK